jgi:tetratricopeptide (TPR) repeat protein
MSARGWAGVLAIAGLAAFAAHDARAQGAGAVDTRKDVAERIRELEMQVGGDESAEQQSVLLLWLADLYVTAGRLDDAQRAYEQILVFFPFDPATTNAYARFLLEQRRDPAHADSILHDALANASELPSPPPYIGESYALRARALRALGRCDEAIAPSDNALALLDEDAAEEALREKAACLRETGRRDEARTCYLQLIGASGGSNADDISAYIALLTASEGHIDAERVRRSITTAISDARTQRMEIAAREGAEIVELRASDGARIEATLRRGNRPGAVVFVPESGARRTDFTPYAQLLALDGVTTLTVDPRGHGDSRCDSLPEVALLSDAHRARISDDIATAIAHLRDRLEFPVPDIAVVCEGDAGGYVERARHENALPVAVVHLSPIFDPEDRALAAALSFRPPRAALLLASNEDVYAVRSLGYFIDTAGRDAVTTRIFRSSGHGVSLLRDPGNYLTVSDWLDRNLTTRD